MAKQIIRDDLRFLIFSELYLKFDEPKTRRRAFAIFESAIDCFDRKGFEHVTLTMIARESGVTRQLLSHYFKDLNEIRSLTLKYIRLIGQNVVVTAIGKESRPDLILKSYLEAHLKWSANFKNHLRVWLGFLRSSSRNTEDRAMNVAAIEAGTNRIQELLEAGKSIGVFDVPDTRKAARLIQTLLLGWLVSSITEEIDERIDQLGTDVVKQSLEIAGARAQS